MIDQTIFALSLWDVFQKEGKESLAEDNLDEALERFMAAMQTAEKQYGKDGPRVATSKRYLALIYHKQGNSKKAEAEFKDALAILEKQLGAESMALIKPLRAYAELLESLDRKDEAITMLSRAHEIDQRSQEAMNTSDIFEEELPENADEMAMSNDQLKRIKELLQRDEIPEQTRLEIQAKLNNAGNSYLWGFETQRRLRQEIVRAYQPKISSDTENSASQS